MGVLGKLQELYSVAITNMVSAMKTFYQNFELSDYVIMAFLCFMHMDKSQKQTFRTDTLSTTVRNLVCWYGVLHDKNCKVTDMSIYRYS